MKRFLKQIIYFSVTVIVIVLLCSSINKPLIHKHILNEENFYLGDSTEILMIGDSHIGLSLNPEFIPNSNNQAIIGEHYLYTYTRLKKFLSHNSQIRYVILGFSYANIAKEADNKLVNGRDKSFFFAKEFMLLDEEEIAVLSSTDLIFIRNYLAWKCGFPTRENIPLIIKTFSSNFSKEELPFMGSFINKKEESDLSNAKERIEEGFNLKIEYEIAELQISYLKKIIDLCEKYDVNLILYTSPLSTGYYELIPPFYISKFDSIGSALSKQITLLNKAQYPLPDSCFQDANHLNAKGAKIMSLDLFNVYLLF